MMDGFFSVSNTGILTFRFLRKHCLGSSRIDRCDAVKEAKAYLEKENLIPANRRSWTYMYDLQITSLHN